MIALVRGASPASRRARMTRSTIGMKKQSDLPEPVPVVTTKLCASGGFCDRLRLVPVEDQDFTVDTRKTWPVSGLIEPSATSSSMLAPRSKCGLMLISGSGQKRRLA